MTQPTLTDLGASISRGVDAPSKTSVRSGEAAPVEPREEGVSERGASTMERVAGAGTGTPAPAPDTTGTCNRCGGQPTRLYICGPRDASCSPAALAGRPEPGRTGSDYQPTTYALPPLTGRAEYQQAREQLAYEDRDQLRRVVDLELPEVS